MANFKKGVVILNDITENAFNVNSDLSLNAMLESFSYDYVMPTNGAGKTFGATEPTILKFSIRLKNVTHGKILYQSAYQNESMKFTFLFDQTYDIDKTKITSYGYGMVVDGYVVHLEEDFHSSKDAEGLDRQTIVHLELLLRSVTHISGMSGAKVLTTTFVDANQDADRKKMLVKGDSSIRLSIEITDKYKLSLVCVTGSKEDTVTFQDKKDELTKYIVTPQSINLTKAINSPNEIKARLYFYPLLGRAKFISRDIWENRFCGKRVELTIDEKVTICKDYYVQEIIPTYLEDGSLYIDLKIYSPDYLLTMKQSSGSFVGKRLSDIAKEKTGHYQLPYDKTKNLQLSNMAKTLHFLVDKDGNEHILPYLVQYNESDYDFLCRTANRWGEFMFYENGKLNIGYDDIVRADLNIVIIATPEEKKVEGYRYCHSISYEGPTLDEGRTTSPIANISLEAAQEFLDNVLKRDMYEDPLNEIDTVKNRDRGYDKYMLKNLGKAFTTTKDIPMWASDSLVADLVSYGQAKRYTDALRAKFNDDYFIKPKNDIPKYSLQYVKEGNDAKVFNEFTENDPSFFKKYDTDTYKTVLAQELSRSRSTVVLDFDTSYPKLDLGDKLRIGTDSEDYYFVTEINMELHDSRPSWKVKAIHDSGVKQKKEPTKTGGFWHYNCATFYPPYLPSGHTRKSGMMKAEVVDADDPMRQNRVRVRFDWQEEDCTPTPWLMVAQDGTTPGAGSHMRHYVGEKVLVDFIGGNVERPYVVGSIQEQLPLKDNWNSPIDAIVRTPNGQSLLMSDGTGAGLTAFRTVMKPGFRAMQSLAPDVSPLNPIDFWKDDKKLENKRFEGSVEIKDYYNIYQIKCSTNDRQVSISSPWGNVDINAFTGINITAPNGDIKISGKNVTIEAGNNLKLISGTNIQNKFIPEEGAKALGNNLALQAAAKALLAFDEKGAIDFAMLRHIRDMFIKPVEGVLEVQSNRFLKLEADGAITGYPASAYKNMKKPDKSQRTEDQWYQMGDAVAALIAASWDEFYSKYLNYCYSFSDAQLSNNVFITAVKGLKGWSEAKDDLEDVEKIPVCKLYSGLKEKLMSDGGEKLNEEDMGFVNDLVGVEDKAKTEQCEARKRTLTHKAIIETRKTIRATVLSYAIDLQKAIQQVKASQFDSEKIVLIASEVYKNLPEDYEDIVKKALSKEKCSKSELYKTMTDLKKPDLEDEKYKKLANKEDKETQNQLIALRHLIALNLLEGLGFKAKKDDKKMEISDLVKSKEDLLENWNKTAGYIDYAYDPINGLASFRRMKAREKDVWSEAKNGQILISSGIPYTLGRETKPIYQKSNDLKTADLVNQLSEPIKKAMEVSAIDKINISGTITSTKIEYDINRMSQLIMNPKKD